MQDFEALKNAWRDKHALEIMITDHIDELKVKDTYMKMHDIPKSDNEYRQAFEKECIDLYLLLAVKFASEVGQEKVNARIQNILEKIRHATTAD
ncbi:MAG: hypothetical protein IJV75_02645 [Alphaproteobacteria bacterium]|nr:hypothetical protein [Alphaproteobacteria bacterium]MBR6675347.1 hypothetical protein [Alphaproteobacteria bacterium]